MGDSTQRAWRQQPGSKRCVVPLFRYQALWYWYWATLRLPPYIRSISTLHLISPNPHTAGYRHRTASLPSPNIFASWSCRSVWLWQLVNWPRMGSSLRGGVSQTVVRCCRALMLHSHNCFSCYIMGKLRTCGLQRPAPAKRKKKPGRCAKILVAYLSLLSFVLPYRTECAITSGDACTHHALSHLQTCSWNVHIFVKLIKCY